jgi:hypothetical protein
MRPMESTDLRRGLSILFQRWKTNKRKDRESIENLIQIKYSFCIIYFFLKISHIV